MLLFRPLSEPNNVNWGQSLSHYNVVNIQGECFFSKIREGPTLSFWLLISLSALR